MPKFLIEIEKEVPSFRERATVVVEADNLHDVENNFDLNMLDDVELDWEEVLEGNGGEPCNLEIIQISPAEDTVEADIELVDEE